MGPLKRANIYNIFLMTTGGMGQSGSCGQVGGLKRCVGAGSCDCCYHWLAFFWVNVRLLCINICTACESIQVA